MLERRRILPRWHRKRSSETIEKGRILNWIPQESSGEVGVVATFLIASLCDDELEWAGGLARL